MFNILIEKQTKNIVEKSKFFGFVFKINSSVDIKEHLKQIKKEYSSSTQICFASVYYQKRNQKSTFENQQDNFCYNYSDDKEPTGTAGFQILNVLKETNMVNTLIVVVRYFGGIKLGIAGLSKAYKKIAQSLVEKNKKEVVIKTRYAIKCNYNDFDNIKSKIFKNADFFNVVFEKDVKFDVFLNLEEYEKTQNFKNIIVKNKFEEAYI